MLHPRRFVGSSTLRVFALVSAAALAVGSGVWAGDALAAPPPAVQAVPAFTSDRLSVEVIGQGPDVILIPGFGCSREVWRAEAERLRARHRVHLVQLAGFAGEPWSHGDGPFVQPAVEELARYIRETRLHEPAVVGHSMGGMGGLMLAQQHPELVGKVMTVDSLPFFSALFGPQATAETARPFAEQAAAGMLAASDADFRAGQVRTAAGYTKTLATAALIVEWTAAGDRRAMASAIREVMTTDLRPGLAAMTVPVWAPYAADAEGGAPPERADQIWTREYAGLPGVRLIRVDGTRHFIMADQPARFAEIMDAFLAA